MEAIQFKMCRYILLWVSIMGWAMGSNLDYIELEQNGYEGITLALQPGLDTLGHSKEEIIQEIKDLLTETSSSLYKASGNRAYFRTIDIILPEDWTEVASTQIHLTKKWNEATLVVRSPSERTLPSAVHGGACGVEGSGINMPLSYIMDQGYQQKYGDAGKVLSAEWLKLRYGVFEEFGYLDDELYPLYHYNVDKNTHHPTGCLDFDNSEIEWIDSNGEVCEPEDSAKDCRPKIKSTSSQHSIMYAAFQDEVKEVCREENHDPAVPSRQNKLCGKRSILDVMFQHPKDFAQNSNNPGADGKDTTPEFRVFSPKKAENVMILLDDHCGPLDSNYKCGISSKAVFTEVRSILTRLMEESHIEKIGVGIFTGPIFGDCDRIQFMTYFNDRVLLEASTVNLDNLLDFIPRGSSNTDQMTCSTSALNMVWKDLKKEKEEGNIDGDVKILFVQMVNHHITEDPVIFQQDYEGFQVHGVLFGQAAYNEELSDITDQSGGSYRFSKDYNPSLIVSALGGFYPSKTMFVELLQETLEVTNTIEKSFMVDDEVGLKTKVMVTFYDSDKDTLEIKLFDPQGIEQSPSETEEVHSYLIPDTTSGKWALTITSTTTDTKVQASTITEPRSAGVEEVTVKTWTSSPEEGSEINLAWNDVAFFALVTKGEVPVTGLTVSAKMYKTDSLVNSDVVFRLNDDGNGDPDIQRNDGIYSSYVTDFGTGASDKVVSYGFDIIIESSSSTRSPNADVISPLSALPSDPFDKHPCCGSESSEGKPLAVDFIGPTDIILTVSRSLSYDPPPGMIVDFRTTHQTNIDDKTAEVEFSWTEPGDNFHQGTALKYELHYCGNKDDVVNSINSCNTVGEGDISNGDLKPGPSGNAKTITAKLSIENGPLYCAIRAVDGADKQGKLSPIASVRPADSYTPKPVVDTTTPPPQTSTPKTSTSTTMKPDVTTDPPVTTYTQPSTTNNGYRMHPSSFFLGINVMIALAKIIS